jgi:hypothetical protein
MGHLYLWLGKSYRNRFATVSRLTPATPFVSAHYFQRWVYALSQCVPLVFLCCHDVASNVAKGTPGELYITQRLRAAEQIPLQFQTIGLAKLFR